MMRWAECFQKRAVIDSQSPRIVVKYVLEHFAASLAPPTVPTPHHFTIVDYITCCCTVQEYNEKALAASPVCTTKSRLTMLPQERTLIPEEPPPERDAEHMLWVTADEWVREQVLVTFRHRAIASRLAPVMTSEMPTPDNMLEIELPPTLCTPPPLPRRSVDELVEQVRAQLRRYELVEHARTPSKERSRPRWTPRLRSRTRSGCTDISRITCSFDSGKSTL